MNPGAPDSYRDAGIFLFFPILKNVFVISNPDIFRDERSPGITSCHSEKSFPAGIAMRNLPGINHLLRGFLVTPFGRFPRKDNYDTLSFRKRPERE